MDNNKLINIYNDSDIISLSEYIKDKLYFAILTSAITKRKFHSDIYFFNIDNKLIYNNFYNDFGPLNIGCLFRYCWKINKLLNDISNNCKKIVHYSIQDECKNANAAYLIASYAILYLNKNPNDAYKPLIDGNYSSMKPFQDASLGISNYNIRLKDCLNALYKAKSFDFFNFHDFNLSEYEKYEKLRYGDLNWIVPQKFIAFIGPNDNSDSSYHSPEYYYNYFIKNKIIAIVRLNNNETYDSNRFIKIGIKHYDMFIPDGGIPSDKILNEFLYLSETTNGPIAVHCRAGLGRTGSLISAYLMKHYRMRAREAIAWMRICRPGSVIGHQQTWLENKQNELWQCGDDYRIKHYGNSRVIIPHKYGIYSIIYKLKQQ